jgi:hypothetical protein
MLSHPGVVWCALAATVLIRARFPDLCTAANVLLWWVWWQWQWCLACPAPPAGAKSGWVVSGRRRCQEPALLQQKQPAWAAGRRQPGLLQHAHITGYCPHTTVLLDAGICTVYMHCHIHCVLTHSRAEHSATPTTPNLTFIPGPCGSSRLLVLVVCLGSCLVCALLTSITPSDCPRSAPRHTPCPGQRALSGDMHVR